MDPYIYRLEEVPLKSAGAKKRLEAFLANHGLTLDTAIKKYYGVFRGDSLVGGAGYDGNVIKCAAVDPAVRGEGIINAIISKIVSELFTQGFGNLFVFTKPENRIFFSSLGFYPVEETDAVLLMESDSSAFKRYLQAVSALRRDGVNGAIVMNCNPFTLGHRYLIEQAASQCDNLIIFVVEEDASVFPFPVRLRLIREGTADISNVQVTPGGPYVISAATFPTYFIKEASDATRAYTRLDIGLFGRRIAPAAGVTIRFVGDEPTDRMTAMYNEAMLEILPPLGVEVRIFERKRDGDQAISASRVRRLLAENRPEATKSLVPASTYAYLASPEAEPVLRNLRAP